MNTFCFREKVFSVTASEAFERLSFFCVRFFGFFPDCFADFLTFVWVEDALLCRLMRLVCDINLFGEIKGTFAITKTVLSTFFWNANILSAFYFLFFYFIVLCNIL